MIDVALQFDHIHVTGMGQMSDKIEWLTLNAAAELEEVPVTGKTLREMIQRGDVPEGHWMETAYGSSVIYLIDRAILPSLQYRKPGGRGKQKDKTDS